MVPGRVHVFLAALLFMAPIAHAEPITYTQSGLASGSLGSSSFATVLVTLSMTADTSAVVRESPRFVRVIGPASVRVAGIGSAAFSDPISIIVNQGFNPPAGGFAVRGEQTGSIFLTFNEAFADYDLRRDIGPLSGQAFVRPDLGFDTTAGVFRLTEADESTFTADLAAEPVPEPATLILIGAALSCVGARRVRQRFQARRQ